MEFVAAKKTRSRKRKRNSKNKRRTQRKFEVKGTTNRRKGFLGGTSTMRDDVRFNMMDAHSFWQNYTASLEWQQRHSVAWWKSHSRALEYENQMLRQKLRDLASKQGPTTAPRCTRESIPRDDGDDAKTEEDDDADDENFEFEVDKDMLNFLEQSIRHKMELKRRRDSETEAISANETSGSSFVTAESRVQAKMEDARLLYGIASPGIMAMEAALQATVDRHKDRAKPSYWPNIPLKP